MKYLLLLFLLAATAAHAQMQPPVPTSAELKRAAEAKELEKLPASTETLDAKNGFRQYKLGSSIVDYPNLKLRGASTYVAPNESMTIGDIRLMTLGFASYQNKLAAISFSTMGEANSNKLLAVLTAQYGQGQEAGYNKLAWTGSKVTMTFEKKTSTAAYRSIYSSATTGIYCEVYIVSNELVAEMNARDKAAAKKAAGDL
ncbi:hypothetical protein [Hymenobacter cheonanensis]|uniref:hypothetical protein n=1 Tax=Hymenobacter sp. CA2-7 TaxID=3063993 RepID=UPI0027135785|nr:hypothetical protein [Hymenobacter sp. CA2-7]MDO7888291.1 hypothetical protein [Hymenobacter sp. CA2-7]